PVLVVALGEILSRVRAAAFGAVARGIHGDYGLRDQVVELERLDQVRVPDQRAVGDLDVGHAGIDLVDELMALVQYLAGAEHRAVVLHYLLHLQPQLRGRRLAGGVAELVETGERLVGGILRQVGMAVAGMQDLGAAHRGGAAEHDEVDQRVRAEPVGAVHGDAGRLAQRHQPRYHEVVVAVPLGQHLAVIIRGDATHVVVHGGHDRDRLTGDVYAGEDARGFRDAGQALVQHRRVEMV